MFRGAGVRVRTQRLQCSAEAEAPKDSVAWWISGPSVGRRGAKMDVTVLLFR